MMVTMTMIIILAHAPLHEAGVLTLSCSELLHEISFLRAQSSLDNELIGELQTRLGMPTAALDVLRDSLRARAFAGEGGDAESIPAAPESLPIRTRDTRLLLTVPSMPCSAAELPIAKEAVALYTAGDTDSALAKLGELQGGKGGTCSSCLLAHTDAPAECMCVRLPIAVVLPHALCLVL